MITGDHPVTAGAIARSAGLDSATVITGTDLQALSDEDLKAAVAGTDVFARIQPDQKLRIVHALQARGARSSQRPATASTTPPRSGQPTSAWPWAVAAPMWRARRRR
jgi:hypothetical protein